MRKNLLDHVNEISDNDSEPAQGILTPKVRNLKIDLSK